MKTKRILCLGMVMVLVMSLFGAIRVSGDFPLALTGDVYRNGGAPGQATDENSYALAVFIYTAVTGPDGQGNMPQVQFDINDADGTNASFYDWDVGSMWDWQPCVSGTQDVMVVLETVKGFNGWTGSNYTTSSNTTLSCAAVEVLPDVQIRQIPTPALNMMGPTWINITWTGLNEDIGIGPNIMNYTVNRATAIGGPYNPVGTSTPQNPGGSVFYNDTGLAGGTFYYRLAVNYSRGLSTYTTTGLSEPLTVSLGDVTPPTIQTTNPVNMATGVALNQDVVITFSEPINTTTYGWSILPDPGGWVWAWNSPANTSVTGTHTDFTTCQVYNFTVTGADDLAGNPLGAGPVANPWNWTTTGCDVTPPEITVTDPVNLATGVAISQPVVITFNEAIDTGTFAYTSLPDPGGWVWVWSVGDTVATGTHANFATLTTYNFTVDTADDLAGNPLASGAVANPWNWTTVAADITSPNITTTNPMNLEIGVAVNQNVIITFSEPMNTTTFTYTILPDPFGWIWSWSVGDTIATGIHTDFASCQVYNFTVNTAEDVAGNPLAPGPVANPWNWTTTGCDVTSPEISITNPVNMATGVTISQAVVITFNEAIDTGTFAYTTLPDPGGWVWVWSVGDTVATGTHTNFAVLTTYNFTVDTADDLAGNPLTAGAVANPWNWTTEGADTTPPTITTTVPIDQATGVAAGQDVVITFSEPMNTTTFTYSISPDPGGWTWVWNVGNTTTTGTHTDFALCQVHDFNVTAADDLAGNPLAAGPVANPWNWTTTGCDVTPPNITTTNPSDGATGVPTNQVITITFSEEIDTATFAFDNCSPDPGGWGLPSWNAPANTIVTLSHNDFTASTLHTCEVTAADDMSGNSLGSGPVVNPWSFTTAAGADLEPPFILTTSPVDQSTGIPITAAVVITFNESIDTSSFAYTIAPDPGGWSENWNATNEMVTLTHSSDFALSTTYDFNVTVANDLSGNPLTSGTVPNPFSFTTGAAVDTTPPSITQVGADPSSQIGAGEVNITANVTDDSGTVTVTVEVTNPSGTVLGNFTMIFDPSTGKYYYSDTYTDEDIFSYDYTIWANDPSGNYDSATGTFYITGGIGTTIFGNITSGSERLNGATVELFDSSGTSIATVTSAAVLGLDGIYAIPAVDPGTYEITVSKDGYKTLTKTVTVTDSDILKIVNFDLEKEGDLLWLWILIILLVIVFLIIFILLARKKKKPEEAPPGEELEYVEPTPEQAEEPITEGAPEGESAEPGVEAGAVPEGAVAATTAPAAAAAAPAGEKTCASCGKPIKPEFKRCPYCGAFQEAESGSGEAGAESTEGAGAEEKTEAAKEDVNPCKNCGKSIPSGLVVCPFCGTAV
jgi:methionine-rich copper-binding protein CopC/RNA polymerase subunit RPABC4/transcription elongation factor Spt4